MKPKLVHVLDTFGSGGTEAGVLNLIRLGFYDTFDLHVVGLGLGNDQTYNKFVKALGPDRVNYLSDQRQNGSSRSIWTCENELKTALRRISPEKIVLSGNVSVVLGRTVAAAEHNSAKVVTFEHSQIVADEPTKVRMRATSITNDAVFCDSTFVREAIRPYYRDKIPAYVVPLTIQEPAEPRRIEVPEEFEILSFGRLSPEKNYAELIMAAHSLAKKGARFKITIAGEGPQRLQLEQLIGELNLTEHVFLPGHIAGTAELRKRSHIYIQPSLHEGSCLAFVEAMAAGIVVVGTNVGGMKEYGEHGINMIKLQGGSQLTIADTLSYVMRRYDSIAAPLSHAALATAAEHFSANSVRRQWEPAIAELHALKRQTFMPHKDAHLSLGLPLP